MRTLSVRQPWAYLLSRGWKDIENRTWSTEYRGPLLIHAGTKKMTKDDWQWLDEWTAWNRQRLTQHLPSTTPADIHYGGIVGMVTLADVVTESASGWFDPGGYGFVCKEAKILQFFPCKGQLGFWDVAYPFEVTA